MSRKFLFCFPLRAGNIVFGYIVMIISLAVLLFHLYELCLSITSPQDVDAYEKFNNFDNLRQTFGATPHGFLVDVIIWLYHINYIVVAVLLFIFSIIFTCGSYKGSQCLVTTFFVYSFFHLFFTIGPVVWESLTSGWLQLGLILLSDFLLIICLFSVKNLMEAIRNGNIYSRPGEVYDKY